MAQILVIDDNLNMREGIAEVLKRAGHQVRLAKNGEEGLALLRGAPTDIVISDIKMDGISGMDVLASVMETEPDTIVLMITAYGSIETAVEAMKMGAFDFITKPFAPDMLRVKVEKALDVNRMGRENRFFRAESVRRSKHHMIGDCQAMQTLKSQIERVAPSETTVLITGESGTGKELIARSLHELSPRAKAPFIKVDCAALTETLLESELFGHERGSFTGAEQRKPGRFELADGGSIFLDEIGEIPENVQLKLLRVLQDRQFERVGGTRTLDVDVRVIAATNKNLQEEVHAKRFREDLFYRLNIVPLQAPSLRDRREDIPKLVEHFLVYLSRKHARNLKMDTKAMDLLTRYVWPGNVRELQNLMERLAVMSAAPTITVEDLPKEIFHGNRIDSSQSPQRDYEGQSLPNALESLEKTMISSAMEKWKGNKSKAARELGVKTSALYYKLEKYGFVDSSK